MKPLNVIEKCALLLGLGFILAGAWMIIHPSDTIIIHQGYRYSGQSPPEHVSKQKSQIYGGLAIVLGAGITWLAFYRGREARG